ncbi:MAG: helix-turn-helix domain-containing protein [Tannerella sp.]|jgi:transcriptional regulator with XRE-family HTH domain|nr:helix-turn-helix domain-containing protein [Tannerella sp.]
MEVNKIHIGNFIKDTVKQSDYSLSEVARRVGISRQKFNGWLNKDDWSVKDLFSVSKAVNIDFVKHFCLPKEDEQETKVILHIEVGKNKMNDVLKVIKDRQLYDILKE